MIVKINKFVVGNIGYLFPGKEAKKCFQAFGIYLNRVFDVMSDAILPIKIKKHVKKAKSLFKTTLTSFSHSLFSIDK